MRVIGFEDYVDTSIVEEVQPLDEPVNHLLLSSYADYTITWSLKVFSVNSSLKGCRLYWQ
jgi:hypothetical protein